MDLVACPPEILSNIFKYLPLADRKNVRLTCHSWNDACNCPEIIRGEKFVFRAGSDHGDIEYMGECIARCKTIRSSFEFEGIYLSRLPSIVWHQCGARIRKLYIYDSKMSVETMTNMIIHCCNLTHFCVQSQNAGTCSYWNINQDDIIFNGPKRPTSFPEAAIDELIKMKIVRKNLVSLKLFIHMHCFEHLMYRKLYEIFPCIRALGVYFWKGRKPLPKEDDWIFPASIESFSTNNWMSMDLHWKMTVLKFRKLKTMVLIDEPTDLTRVMNFFSYQMQLEKLQLKVVCLRKRHVKLVLFHILDNLPQLKKLHVHFKIGLMKHFRRNFSFTVKEFGEFLNKTSQLESLILLFDEFKLKYSNLDELQTLPSTTYTKLKKLHLGKEVDRVIALEILNRCRTSLRYLHLKPVDDEIMHKIFETQIELQTLQVRSEIGSSAGQWRICPFGVLAQNNSDYSPKQNQSHSSNRLKNLEHLELEIASIALDIFDSSFKAFNFPNLKYFHFKLNFKSGLTCEFNTKENSEQYLRLLPSMRKVLRKLFDILSVNAPNLDTLRFYRHGLDAIEFMDYCKKLKHLRIIIIDREYEYIENLQFEQNLHLVAEKLFVECTSLQRVVSLETNRVFCYDRFSNKLKQFHYDKFSLRPNRI